MTSFVTPEEYDAMVAGFKSEVAAGCTVKRCLSISGESALIEFDGKKILAKIQQAIGANKIRVTSSVPSRL